MRCLGIALLITCASLTLAKERDHDGVLRTHSALGIRVWYDPNEIKSENYPQPAPYNMEQTWRFVAFTSDEEGINKAKALKIVCTDVDIPKDRNGCTETKLVLYDGSSTKEWCGPIKPFTLVTKTEDIKLVLTTGRNGGGRVSCTAQAVYVDSNKNEITTTTTAKPPPRNSFRFLPSEEVDSSEHGGEEGVKSTSCACGWANKFASRIVNGTEAKRNEFPFAAALIERDTHWRFCGSTIITEYHAITAAHCTEGPVRENIPLAIIVGIHNLNDEIKPPAKVIDVEMILQHQEYTGAKSGWKHDLTLLILKDRIQFGPYVGPACLPTHQVNLDRQYIKVIGWGGLYWQGPQSEYLRKIDVRVVPIDECNYEYSGVNKDNPTQICTYSKHRASCQGDSGGPVIWVDPETNRYTLVGAVSFGAMCGRAPTVHTHIGHYLDWIEHYVKVSKGSQLCRKIN